MVGRTAQGREGRKATWLHGAPFAPVWSEGPHKAARAARLHGYMARRSRLYGRKDRTRPQGPQGYMATWRAVRACMVGRTAQGRKGRKATWPHGAPFEPVWSEGPHKAAR